MAPLLTLRSTVSSLAGGMMDLSPRAEVNSADEFGELARDLNHFLDRIGVVVHDLDRILGDVGTVGTLLGALNRDLGNMWKGGAERRCACWATARSVASTHNCWRLARPEPSRR